MKEEEKYPALITVLCIISWFLWFVVLILISPKDLGVLSIVLFLASLAVALCTSFLLLLFYIRIRLLKRAPMFREFHIIFRESTLLTMASIVTLLLFHRGVREILNVALLLFLIVLIDIFCITRYDQRGFKKS